MRGILHLFFIHLTGLRHPSFASGAEVLAYVEGGIHVYHRALIIVLRGRTRYLVFAQPKESSHCWGDAGEG